MPVQRCMLALPWYGKGDTVLAEPLIVCGVGELAKRTVQNAGRAFWDRFEEPLHASSPQASGKSKRDNKDSGEAEREKAYRDKQEKKKGEPKKKDGGLLKMSDELKGRDLYEMLEIEEGASSDDIKKSWRKLVLVHHPDKIPDATEEQKAHFLIMQEAFEIVSDTDRRRRYESTLEFDDDIPSDFGKGKLADADFFETFRPVFKRNTRWSNKKPVPDFGDEETDIEAVKKFYDFWWSFDSWRDPLAMAEKEECDLHNLEEADSREERRWMERENAKETKRFARAEHERIVDLVRTAEKNDPRMIAHREATFKLKTAEKDRRAAAAKAELDKRGQAAREAAEAAEAKRLVDDAKRAEEKKKRDEVKNLLKAARQRLRNIHRAAQLVVRRAVHVDQLQEVCLKLETGDLHKFCEELERAFKKDKKGDFALAISVMHREIVACGLSPIADDKVRGESGASTASGDSDEEPSEGDKSPQRELTPEEREKDRLRLLEEEAKERERQERKAEEQRKKRDKLRQEEEKRQAALRKQEKKEREAQVKQQEKDRKQAEQKGKQAEEQRQKQMQQREEERVRVIEEEAARKEAHEEHLISRAFEKDRIQRIAILEAYDEAMLDAALKNTMMQDSEGNPDAQLQLALSKVAAAMPSMACIKNDQASREIEEHCLDMAAACLAQCAASASGDTQEPRLRLGRALAIAVRPPAGLPEVSKEAKAAMKKARNRVRMAVLVFVRSLALSEPAPAADSASAPAPRKPIGNGPPDVYAVRQGTELMTAEEGTLFESTSSYSDLGSVKKGDIFTATGPPVEVEGFFMVPIAPKGAIELRIVRAVAPLPKAAPPAAKAKGGKAAGAGPKVPVLGGVLRVFAEMAAAGPVPADAAPPAVDIAQVCFCGFDAAAVVNSEPPSQVAAATVQANVGPQEAAEQPAAAAAPKGKKAAKAAPKPAEEDLDALLQEFGMTNQGGSGKKKKGGKK